MHNNAGRMQHSAPDIPPYLGERQNHIKIKKEGLLLFHFFREHRAFQVRRHFSSREEVQLAAEYACKTNAAYLTVTI